MTCPVCNGRGSYNVARLQLGAGPVQKNARVACGQCGGTGKLPEPESGVRLVATTRGRNDWRRG